MTAAAALPLPVATASAPAPANGLPDNEAVAGEDGEGAVFTFGDLLKLKAALPVSAQDETAETPPTAAGLEAILPQLGAPMGVGITLPVAPETAQPAASTDPALAAITLATSSAASAASAASVASAASAADAPADPAASLLLAAHAEGSGPAPAQPAPDATALEGDLGLRASFYTGLADLAERLASAASAGGTDGPLTHVRSPGELALPLPGKVHDDHGAAMAAAGLAPGPAPAPGNSSNVQPSAPPPVTVPPSHPDWGREVAASVAWSVKHDATDVEIRLHPPELGALRVLLKIDGDQVQATFSAPLAETRHALEQTLPRLRELLAGQGLSLMQAQVSDQQRQAPQATPFTPHYAESAAEPEFTAPVVVRLRAAPGRLDEYA